MAEPPEFPPGATFDTVDIASRFSMFVPHVNALGMTLVAMEKGKGTMTTPWREDLVGDPETDVIASGVVTALLDQTCGLAISSARDTATPIATLDLRIDYMRPAAPRTGVTCEAQCYRLTRSVGFVRAEAWDVDRGDLVAIAQAAFMLNPRG